MQVNLNNHLSLMGSSSFKIDSVFHPLDQIVPKEFQEDIGKMKMRAKFEKVLGDEGTKRKVSQSESS